MEVIKKALKAISDPFVALMCAVVVMAFVLFLVIINPRENKQQDVCYTIVAQGQTYELEYAPDIGTLANGTPVISFENNGERVFITGGAVIKYNKNCEKNNYAISN